jgi:hypothetical protein
MIGAFYCSVEQKNKDTLGVNTVHHQQNKDALGVNTYYGKSPLSL